MANGNVIGQNEREHSCLIKCGCCEYSNIYKTRVEAHIVNKHGEKCLCTISQVEHNKVGLKI